MTKITITTLLCMSLLAIGCHDYKGSQYDAKFDGATFIDQTVLNGETNTGAPQAEEQAAETTKAIANPFDHFPNGCQLLGEINLKSIMSSPFAKESEYPEELIDVRNFMKDLPDYLKERTSRIAFCGEFESPLSTELKMPFKNFIILLESADGFASQDYTDFSTLLTEDLQAGIGTIEMGGQSVTTVKDEFEFYLAQPTINSIIMASPQFMASYVEFWQSGKAGDVVSSKIGKRFLQMKAHTIRIVAEVSRSQIPENLIPTNDSIFINGFNSQHIAVEMGLDASDRLGGEVGLFLFDKAEPDLSLSISAAKTLIQEIDLKSLLGQLLQSARKPQASVNSEADVAKPGIDSEQTADLINVVK